jgi:predicted acetyltransferase
VADVEIVHGIPVTEADPWTRTMRTTFLESADGPDFEATAIARARSWVPDRRWGARADGRWVATLATLERTLTVPGPQYPLATIPADGLTQVTVSGTHRRRGLLTGMLSDSLRAARDRGDAVSILIAAETTIYGRFGYAPAERTATYTLHSHRPGSAPERAGGQLRTVDADELGQIAPAVFAAATGHRAGNIDRPSIWWDRTLGLGGIPYHGEPPHTGVHPNYIVREGPNGPDGYLAWRPDRDYQMVGTYGSIVVDDLISATEGAYRDLWNYLASIDLIGSVKAHRRPVDEALRWLVPDSRALEQTEVIDGIWLRLLDVPAALSGRRYATTDRLVIEITDSDIGGYAAGCYVLDGGPEHASCRPADRSAADVTVNQRALAAIYLGGFTLREQVIAGFVDEHTAGAIGRLDAMFATGLAPWCYTDF